MFKIPVVVILLMSTNFFCEQWTWQIAVMFALLSAVSNIVEAQIRCGCIAS